MNNRIATNSSLEDRWPNSQMWGLLINVGIRCTLVDGHVFNLRRGFRPCELPETQTVLAPVSQVPRDIQIPDRKVRSVSSAVVTHCLKNTPLRNKRTTVGPNGPGFV